MHVELVRAKRKAEKGEALEAGINRFVAAFAQAQRADMRYAWFRLPDGVTSVMVTEGGERVAQSQQSRIGRM